MPSDPNEHLKLELRMAARLAVRQNNGYIIDPVFPTGAMHSIAGPPDVGKTTWSFQWLHDWSLGIPVFGNCKSNPCEWVYVSVDRSLSDTDRTLTRLGFKDWDAPIYAIEELMPRAVLSKRIEQEPTLDHILARFPNIKLLFVEGIQGLIPSIGKGQSINKSHILWLIKTRDKFLNNGGTIIAVNHTPKSSTPAHDRENQLGSQGFIGGMGTCINFGLPVDAHGKEKGMLGPNQTNERFVSIMPKNSPPMYMNLSRGMNGVFETNSVQIGSSSLVDPNGRQVEIFETQSDKIRVLNMYLSAYEGQQELMVKEIRIWAKKTAVSDTEMYQWIDMVCDKGLLVKDGSGRYRRTSVKSDAGRELQ